KAIFIGCVLVTGTIPSLLGFDNVENVVYLRSKVLEKYQFLSNHNEPSTNLDEDESEDPVENIDENSAIKEEVQSGIYIRPTGICLSPKSTQALMVSDNSHKIELYQAHRHIKKLKSELGGTHSRLKEVEVTENNNLGTSPYSKKVFDQLLIHLENHLPFFIRSETISLASIFAYPLFLKL
ncbi:7023_t:CDS:2, partial [Entrophospora sp. SA101]